MESQQFCSLFPRNGVCIAVPSYQRAYSWEKAQWQQLIDDLKESEGNYYLGHFLFEHPEGETDPDKLLVIDGQQRLTTLIIFFSCLRHALSRSEEDYAHISALSARRKTAGALQQSILSALQTNAGKSDALVGLIFQNLRTLPHYGSTTLYLCKRCQTNG